MPLTNMSQNIEDLFKSSEVSSRLLLTMVVSEIETIRLLANDSMPYIDISSHNLDGKFAGQRYTTASIKVSDIESSNDSLEKITLRLSNVWQEWAAKFAALGPFIYNKDCYIHEYVLDYPEEPPILLFSGKADEPKMDIGTFEITLQRSLGDYNSKSPNMTYDQPCQYRKFKDERCKYTGAEEKCDRSITRCIELGNVVNFGGHPSVPREMRIFK
jgi:hypothetical protein